MSDMIREKTWDEFRDSKMLWWVNRTLHLFGWVIALDFEDGKVARAYPARCKFRGFGASEEEDGFIRLTEHIADNIKELESEVKS